VTDRPRLFPMTMQIERIRGRRTAAVVVLAGLLGVLASSRGSEAREPTAPIPEWKAKALFPAATAVDKDWLVKAADLDEKMRGQIKAAGGIMLGYEGSAKWTLAGKKVVVSATAAERSVDCLPGSGSFLVSVFSGHDLVARSHELFAYGTWADAATGDILQVDTARYQISETERAFGVRTKHTLPKRYECFADQTLDLFRVVGKDIVRILHTDVAYEQVVYGPDNEDGDHDPECSVSPKDGTFRMLPTKTNGFFDLERNQKTGVKSLIYRWNGSTYEASTPDPTSHSVRDDWDGCTGPRLERERQGKQ